MSTSVTSLHGWRFNAYIWKICAGILFVPSSFGTQVLVQMCPVLFLILFSLLYEMEPDITGETVIRQTLNCSKNFVERISKRRNPPHLAKTGSAFPLTHGVCVRARARPSLVKMQIILRWQ